MTTTFDRLAAVLAKNYQIDADKLTPDAQLESLGIDSLGAAELLFALEDEFGIRLPPDPVSLTTVGDVVTYVDGLVASQGTAAPPQTP